MLAIEPPPTSSLQSADAMSFGGASEKRPKTHPLRSRAAGGRVAQKGCFQLLRAFFFALCQQAIGAFFKLDCVQRLCHYLLRKMWDQFVSQLIKASNAAHRTEKKG
jgi:hypothetical protein